MLWVFKTTISLRWFFWVPTTYVLVEIIRNLFSLAHSYQAACKSTPDLGLITCKSFCSKCKTHQLQLLLLSDEVLVLKSKGRWFETRRRHCILFPLLSTGSNQEDRKSSWYDWKIVDWQVKQTNNYYRLWTYVMSYCCVSGICATAKRVICVSQDTSGFQRLSFKDV